MSTALVPVRRRYHHWVPISQQGHWTLQKELEFDLRMSWCHVVLFIRLLALALADKDPSPTKVGN